ncbi:hypothetical protein [Streptomyces sp. MI02-7b]|nr:hypothetical protein [Streptomyces sp. MI02-7b]MDX3073681.1 hypothetical protein [Streptomyces sp. MI02-7b]
MAELAEVVDEALPGLGDGITRAQPERDRVNPLKGMPSWRIVRQE